MTVIAKKLDFNKMSEFLTLGYVFVYKKKFHKISYRQIYRYRCNILTLIK